MIDYNALSKSATQNQESDSAKLDEGDSLVYLIPYSNYGDGFPTDHPYVQVEMYAGKASDPFGRSVVCSTEGVTQTQAYEDALGAPPANPCEIGTWASENLKGDDLRGAKPRSNYIWAVCVLASRKKAKNDWQDAYTKPKWLMAKRGSKSKPHIQAHLEVIIESAGREGLEKLFNPDGAQLVVINRTGTGVKGTNYSVSLATGEYQGQDTANFQISDEIREDIKNATKKGEYLDLIQLVADKFSPGHEEIRQKLYGEGKDGDGGSSKPSMSED